MAEPPSTNQADIAAALSAALPERWYPQIPLLAQVLAAACDGKDASIATKELLEALRQLQGTTLNVQSGTITVGNISGEGIAIGHGAISIYMPRSAAEEQAWRSRSCMLEKVRTSWIDGFLKQSLHKIALIDLGMLDHPDALAQPWEMIVQPPDRPRKSVRLSTTIAEVFDEFGGELLILGAPGTGKTTMLLELTRALIEHAQQDETYPLPVVFNLSSWVVKRPPLADWLAEELNIRYGVPRKIAKAWIDNDQVLPLLDGLDEVRQDARNACVQTINAFRGEHGLVGMVVCCRTGDYNAFPQKVRLQGSVELQPLTDQQIEIYLQQVGKNAATVRAVLKQLRDTAQAHEDQAAEELTRTPLLLSITAMAYQGNSDGELPSPAAPPTEQQRHLFATYVARMFTRRGKGTRYTPKQTKQWLGWLASKLIDHNQAIFFLELMQPAWLQREVWYRFDLWTGLMRGSMIGVAVWSIATPLITFLLMVIGLAPTISNTLGPGGTQLLIVTSGVLCVLFYVLIGVNAAYRKPGPEQIHLVEKLIIPDTAMRSALKLGLGVGIPTVLVLSWGRGWIGALTGIAVGIALGTLMVVREMPMVSQSEVRSVPNQGIWRSARNALLLSLLAGVSVGGAIGLSLSLVGADAFGLAEAGTFGTIVGVALGIGMGIFVAILFGAETLFKHGLLRVLLYRHGSIPWNYARFLDYATERIFLRKVGGGYIFVHRLLMEYFASLEPRQGKDESE